jgi:flagellar biosynthesis protein
MNKRDDRPARRAVALRYDGSGAPRVTAKGEGLIAEEILRRAREHGIPLQEDTALAALLARIDLGAEIPEALYRAVAQVLLFAYTLSGKKIPEVKKR